MESRYQRMIDLYPRSWRRQHGPAMLGTLLDVAEQTGRDRPTRGEFVDLAVHAGLARLSLVMPTAVRQGVAAVALATGTGFAVAYIMFAGWAPFLYDREFYHSMFSFGPFMNSGVVLCAAWIASFGFALLGWRRTAQVALVATLVIAGITLVANHTVHEWTGTASRNVGFLALLGALALLGNPASRPRLAVGVAGWFAAFVGLYAANGMLHADGDRFFWFRIATPTNILLALFVGVVLAVCLLAARRPRSAIVVLWSFVPWLAAAWLGFALDDVSAAAFLLMALSVVGALVIAAGYALRRAGITVRIVRESQDHVVESASAERSI